MSQVVPQRSRVVEYETPPILRARGLRRSFKMGDQTLTVLKDVDIALRPGEFVAIEGRSGSGKSTLLHIMGALDTADEGTLQFEGRDYTRHSDAGPASWVRALSGRAMFWAVVVLAVSLGGLWLAGRIFKPDPDLLAQFQADLLTGKPLAELQQSLSLARAINVAWWVTFALLTLAAVPFLIASAVKLVHYLLKDRKAAQIRNRDFGFVFQFYHLLPELNVLENTMLSPMIRYSWRSFLGRRRELRRRATEVLEQLGMSHRLRHRPGQLSGGERQRVAIARALMNNPRVLFADEPTGNLDAETGRQIMGVLERLHQQQGQTIVMVTHDRTLARQADRVLVMKDGKLDRAEA